MQRLIRRLAGCQKLLWRGFGSRSCLGLSRPDVRAQALGRLQELEDTRLRLGDQITMQAGALLEQQAAVEVEHQQLAALVEVLP
jgi:hypothetical protein